LDTYNQVLLCTVLQSISIFNKVLR